MALYDESGGIENTGIRRQVIKEITDFAKKYDVSMPIVEQVNHILFDDKKAADAVMELMLRDKTIENSELPWEE